MNYEVEHLKVEDNYLYKAGLKKAIKIIEEEMEYAKQVNPQMAIGMSQIKMLIEKEL